MEIQLLAQGGGKVVDNGHRVGEIGVGNQPIQIISATANPEITTVLSRYMYAGPATMRTAAMSFVARLMISPV